MTGWRSRAACRPGSGVDPEAFFPAGRYGTAYQQQVARAKTICARCPALRDCYDDAIRTRDVEFGVRAGLTPDERRSAASDAGRAQQHADAERAASAVRDLPDGAWSAIDDADSRGYLPPRLSTHYKQLLVRAGVAVETQPVARLRGGGRPLQLTATGRVLAAARNDELTGARS